MIAKYISSPKQDDCLQHIGVSILALRERKLFDHLLKNFVLKLSYI